MLRLVRVLILLLPVVALLAAGNSFARTGKGPHKCEGMVAGLNMDDCMRDGSGAAPDCPPGDCLSPQIFLLPTNNFLPNLIIRIVAAPTPRNEARLGGLSGPPDLRPPIG
jgi:hypothetical protein